MHMQTPHTRHTYACTHPHHTHHTWCTMNMHTIAHNTLHTCTPHIPHTIHTHTFPQNTHSQHTHHTHTHISHLSVLSEQRLKNVKTKGFWFSSYHDLIYWQWRYNQRPHFYFLRLLKCPNYSCLPEKTGSESLGKLMWHQGEDSKVRFLWPRRHLTHPLSLDSPRERAVESWSCGSVSHPCRNSRIETSKEPSPSTCPIRIAKAGNSLQETEPRSSQWHLLANSSGNF